LGKRLVPLCCSNSQIHQRLPSNSVLPYQDSPAFIPTQRSFLAADPALETQVSARLRRPQNATDGTEVVTEQRSPRPFPFFTAF
jgi:hypothetical protein